MILDLLWNDTKMILKPKPNEADMWPKMKANEDEMNMKPRDEMKQISS